MFQSKVMSKKHGSGVQISNAFKALYNFEKQDSLPPMFRIE